MVYVPVGFPTKAAHPRQPKTPKYKNKKIKYQGKFFDSIGERDRYLFLLSEQENGHIRNLQRQVTFSLEVNGHHICRYIADFTYEKNMVDTRPGAINTYTESQMMPDGWVNIVEDFKGVITDVFTLKAKLFHAQYGFEILITRRPAWRSSNVMEAKSWKTKQ